MRAQRFFRYLWRIDAVLILIAAGAITFGVGALLWEEFSGRAAMRRNAEAGVPVAGEPRLDPSLGHAETIPGSPVLRANLFVSQEGRGFSSSGYNETRNILFIDPSQGKAHWLLPDNDHVVAEHSDLAEEKDLKRRVVATVVLVKPKNDHSERTNGKLLLFDSSGANIIDVANEVRDMHVATLDGSEIRILYERNRKLTVAAFDSASLAKKREHEIDVPQLK
jgi:ribosomal protein L14